MMAHDFSQKGVRSRKNQSGSDEIDVDMKQGKSRDKYERVAIAREHDLYLCVLQWIRSEEARIFHQAAQQIACILV
jgi:hypothetical protein